MVRRSVGLLGLCHQSAFAVDDVGDGYSGYWSPPNVVMFSSSGTGFTRIGEMAAKYCPGYSQPQSPCTQDPAGPSWNGGTTGKFFSGVSVAADSSEIGVCHLVWSEGGIYGTAGQAGSVGGCPVPLIFDAGPPSQGYRVGYSVWNSGAKTNEYDLWDTTASRPPNAGISAPPPYPVTWPDASGFAASNMFQVRNDEGSPVLFIAGAYTVSDGGTDYLPSHPPVAGAGYVGGLATYDISTGSPSLLQTWNSALAPTELGSLDSFFSSFSEGFNSLGTLAISNLYTDPLLSSAPVYIPAISFGLSGSLVGTAFYRIKGDMSSTFDDMDGRRAVGYSMLPASYGDLTTGIQRFFSEVDNVWTNPHLLTSPRQLDRKCRSSWISYGTYSFMSGVNLGFDGSHTLFSVGLYGAVYALTKIDICRGCYSCACNSVGLHVWQRF